MNRNIIIGTALVIVIISAVLVMVTASSETSPDVKPQDPVSPILMEDSIVTQTFSDSIVKLGNSGYSVVMPHGYALSEEKGDTSFMIIPHDRFDQCMNLHLDFRAANDWPIVGRRPERKIVVNIMGREAVFRHYRSDGFVCEWRSGGLGLDQESVVIHCYAPGGIEMDRLFAIATSLQKSQ